MRSDRRFELVLAREELALAMTAGSVCVAQGSERAKCACCKHVLTLVSLHSLASSKETKTEREDGK